MDVLNMSNTAYENALLISDDDPEKPGRLSALSDSFIDRYELHHQTVDIDMAISALDDSVRLTPEGNPEKPRRLNDLGGLLMLRFKRLGDPADVGQSIKALEEAVLLFPEGHPDKPGCLSNLGGAFMDRFEQLGNLADINNSIALREDAVRLAPDGDPDKPHYLGNLGDSFEIRFGHLGTQADIDKSIALWENAVRLVPDGHPAKPSHLSNLGRSFGRRFQYLGNLEDIDKSIRALEDSVRLVPDGHLNKPQYLSNLGNALGGRFDYLGKLVDIEKVVALQENAVQLTPDGHPGKPGYLSNLGSSFGRRFEHFGNLADIDKSIGALEEAVRLTPDRYPGKPLFLSNLGGSFMDRFEQLGNLADIDKSIVVREIAVQLTPDKHPAKPSFLSNLGGSFAERFKHLGNPADINKSIKALEEASQLTPDGNPGKPRYLSNLSSSFGRRFEYLGNVADTDQAIKALEKAVRLTPEGHPDKPGYLTNLGTAFGQRFGRSGNMEDINKSIRALEDAVRLTSDKHPDKPACLSNLGGSFVRRFEHLGTLADIDKSIALRENAVRLTPDGHPDKPRCLIHLGDSFKCRFDHFQNQADLDTAALHYSFAAHSLSGSPSLKFLAASQWAQCCLMSGTSSMDAYSCALDLLSRVAWLGQPIAERHRELAKIGNVVCDAAAAAIESQEYDTALEWLEQGRSVVWGQLLKLRTPVDDLRTLDPDLADRLERISKALENAGSRDKSIETSHQPSQPSMEDFIQKHHQLAEDYEKLVEDIRNRSGFEDFLKPKKLAKLKSAARSGPVVVINVHRSRCDALILMADLDEVIPVHLDRFSSIRAEELHKSLDELLSGRGLIIRSTREPVRENSFNDDSQFKDILAELWLSVAKPVLESLAFSVSRSDSDPPRIWWCPTGPLAFLPLHAVGLYDTNEQGHKISDFVVSSYTPTLTALLDIPRTKRTGEFKLLAVTQPSTPGQSSLPNTTRELDCIRKHTDRTSIMSLEGAEATVERVVESMMKCDWIHLACHGTQNIKNPTMSAFFLQDGKLELSKIIGMNLSHAEFAFLSACKTATGDKRLSEEAVHLAGGMLLAGYRGVIATTWSIMDHDAPLVADEVYSRLFKPNPPDRTQAAVALHHAVKHLREHNNVSIFSWVPFIHVGM